MWSYLIGIWICNLYVFITSPVALTFILAWSLVKVKLTTWRWLKIQMCNFSNVSFETFLPFILLSISIHDILFSLVLIFYLLYFAFLVFLIIDRFDTPNILEAGFTALCLTQTKEFDFKWFYFITSGVLIIAINIVCWKLFMSVLI